MTKRTTYRVAATGVSVLGIAIVIGFAALRSETASARRCTRSLAASLFESTGKLRSNLKNVAKLRDPVSGKTSVDVDGVVIFGPTGDPFPRDDNDFDIILEDTIGGPLFFTPAPAFGDFTVDNCTVNLVPLTTSLQDAVAQQVFRILVQEGAAPGDIETITPTITSQKFRAKVKETPEFRSVTVSFNVKYTVNFVILGQPFSAEGTVSFRGRGSGVGPG
jgi:hypothetical protein